MKSHLSEDMHPQPPRYHQRDEQGTFQPIPFAFVTEIMHQQILEERNAILASLPADLKARQLRLFEAYDPTRGHHGFKRILQMFGARAPSMAQCSPG